MREKGREPSFFHLCFCAENEMLQETYIITPMCIHFISCATWKPSRISICKVAASLTEKSLFVTPFQDLKGYHCALINEMHFGAPRTPACSLPER